LFKEHDCVVLTSELPSEGLLPCDVGTILRIYGDAAAYELEFETLTGMSDRATLKDLNK